MKHLKKLTLLLFSFLSISSQAQFPTNEKGEVEYSEVITLEGLTKKQIYDKAKLWIVSTLKSGDNMVELSGDNSDQIVGTGNIILDDLKTGYSRNKRDHIYTPSLNFKFIVFCKDGRFKYELSNIVFHYTWIFNSISSPFATDLLELKPPQYIRSEKDVSEFKSRVTSVASPSLKKLIDDFITTMNTSQSDDW
jgi:uncharacterized protein with TBP-like fold DUF4468